MFGWRYRSSEVLRRPGESHVESVAALLVLVLVLALATAVGVGRGDEQAVRDQTPDTSVDGGSVFDDPGQHLAGHLDAGTAPAVLYVTGSD